MLSKIICFMLCICIYPESAYAFGTSAESSIVISMDTRQILYNDNAFEKMGMASTTKIMTALVALENGNTSDIFTVSKNAQNQEGSSIYLRTNDKITLEALLYGLMLNSGNDAAVAIAEGIGGSVESFVKMMNEKAKEIGCRNTQFKNPNGLSDPEHYSTAYDLALIMAYAMENEEFAKIVSTKEYQIKNENSVTYLRNHNKLLWQTKECIGGKTGFTKANGRCLVSCAEKDGVRIVAVTLNAHNDWNDHKSLYDYAFKKIKKTEVIKKNEILCTRSIRGTKVNILAGESFIADLKNGKKHGILCKINLDESVNCKINSGTKIGTADIYADEYKIGSIPIISGQQVKMDLASIFHDNFDYMLRFVLLK